MAHYLLLMRHAKHEAVDRDEPAVRKLTADGLKETQEVARKLVEVIGEFQNDKDLRLDVREIWRAETSEVIATVEEVVKVLGGHAADTVVPELNPTVFNP